MSDLDSHILSQSNANLLGTSRFKKACRVYPTGQFHNPAFLLLETSLRLCASDVKPSKVQWYNHMTKIKFYMMLFTCVFSV